MKILGHGPDMPGTRIVLIAPFANRKLRDLGQHFIMINHHKVLLGIDI